MSGGSYQGFGGFGPGLITVHGGVHCDRRRMHSDFRNSTSCRREQIIVTCRLCADGLRCRCGMRVCRTSSICRSHSLLRWPQLSTSWQRPCHFLRLYIVEVCLQQRSEKQRREGANGRERGTVSRAKARGCGGRGNIAGDKWVKPPHANTSAPVQDHLAAVRIGGCGPESVGRCTAAQR